MHACILTALPKKINKNRTAKPSTATGSGRTAQRNRTRRAIVEAATQLVAAGGTPSMAEVAEAAQVSRRTIYMYFPALEQLLIDAMLGAASLNTIDPVIAQSSSNDTVTRVEQLSRAMNSHSAETMPLGRALIRLTVEGDEPPAGGPRRGYRRVQWIERALEPAREKLTRQEFGRLVSALCVLIGWEPMIVLKDVRGLDQKQADDVLNFAVRAVVEKALADAEVRARRRSS
jgi:AcrR family transcriptional regulator